jgi:excisionase family DNA binding protein
MESIPPLVVRVPEACRLLGVSRSVLYELIRADAVPSFTVGAARLLPVDGLREWVDRQAAAAREANDGAGR